MNYPKVLIAEWKGATAVGDVELRLFSDRTWYVSSWDARLSTWANQHGMRPDSRLDDVRYFTVSGEGACTTGYGGAYWSGRSVQKALVLDIIRMAGRQTVATYMARLRKEGYTGRVAAADRRARVWFAVMSELEALHQTGLRRAEVCRQQRRPSDDAAVRVMSELVDGARLSAIAHAPSLAPALGSLLSDKDSAIREFALRYVFRLRAYASLGPERLGGIHARRAARRQIRGDE